MTLQIDDNGVQIDTFNEVYERIAQGFRDIYGADIDLDPESPDGQRVGIIAGIAHDLQTYGLNIANMFDPDLATGAFLEKLLKLSGTALRPPIRSQVDVEVTVDRPLTLTEGYTVDDELGTSWMLESETQIASPGTVTVTLFAEEFGPLEAAVGTVNSPATVILGVTGVTNPAAALPGRDEETLPEARRRRRRSVQRPAYSTSGSLFARLADLNGVTDLQVYENNQDTEDSRGVPANGLWVVVDGGDVADIAEVMVKNKTGGTNLRGEVEGTYIETRTRPDGSQFNLTRRTFFDRPRFNDVEVRVNVQRRDPNGPIDLANIAERIAEADFRIAENVIATQLYALAYGSGDFAFFATDMEVRRVGDSTWTDERIVADPDEVLQIEQGNVTVTEVGL